MLGPRILAHTIAATVLIAGSTTQPAAAFSPDLSRLKYKLKILCFVRSACRIAFSSSRHAAPRPYLWRSVTLLTARLCRAADAAYRNSPPAGCGLRPPIRQAPRFDFDRLSRQEQGASRSAHRQGNVDAAERRLLWLGSRGDRFRTRPRADETRTKCRLPKLYARLPEYGARDRGHDRLRQRERSRDRTHPPRSRSFPLAAARRSTRLDRHRLKQSARRACRLPLHPWNPKVADGAQCGRLRTEGRFATFRRVPPSGKSGDVERLELR